MVKAFNFPRELNLNIDKNRSTSFVGGFWEIDAPWLICSEPPSLKSGDNTVQKDHLFKNLYRNLRNRQETQMFSSKYRERALSAHCPLKKILVYVFSYYHFCIIRPTVGVPLRDRVTFEQNQRHAGVAETDDKGGIYLF
jgi:hypothetical protein